MTSNIDILYTVGKNFLSQVWIRDCYLTIRPRLALINYQSFTIMHRKACRWSRHFRRKRRVPLRWEGWEKIVGTLNHLQKWPKTSIWTPYPLGFFICLHHFQRQRFTMNGVGPSYFSIFCFSFAGACRLVCHRHY